VKLFERQLMDALLAGDHPFLEPLRGQLPTLQVSDRTMTDEGFFVKFAVPSASRAANVPNLMIDDVAFDVFGLNGPAYTVLWIRRGLLDRLECYGASDHWPEFPVIERIYYLRAERRSTDTWNMIPTSERDFPSLTARWTVAGAA